MSSNHVCASTARLAGVLLLIVSQGVPALAAIRTGVDFSSSPSQEQPRDPRPRPRQPLSSREQELQAALKTSPKNVSAWLELAKLQEGRGAVEEAERTFNAALSATGGAREVLVEMSGFFNRVGNFEKTMAALEQAAAANPTDPAGHHLVAVYYFDKANKDLTLAPADKLRYAEEGIAAADRALALNDDYVDALTYKNLLLRVKANLETDSARQQALLAEANALRNRAIELNKVRSGAHATSPSGAPPQPPSSPGFDQVEGQQPVRVGGNVKTPTKVHDVRPIYPQEALDARVSGMVILEAVIDTQGNVSSARVLRSIPLLDQAAIDAVKQWRFTPTLLNGIAVPVIMTVTVNFSLE